MDYTVDVNPLKATYSVKEVFQNGAFKLRGIACAVRFKGSRTFLLTPSAVVEATDNRKKLIAERFSRKHVGGYRLDVSVLGQLGNVTFLRIMKEYPRAMSAMGTSWVIGLNLEIPSSERKALGRLLFGTGAGEFELQAQFDGSTQVIPTKSIDWTSILGVPIIIEHIKSSKKQSGLFSVIGVVGLTSEEKFCLCYFDHKNTGNLDMLLSKLKKAKGPTDIKELVEEEPSTAPAQAMAAINLREHRPSASLETEDQRSWRECGETSTARAQAMAASINLHEQGPSAVMETEDQCSWRECGETSTAQAQAIAAINLLEQGPVASLETEDQRSWRECGEAVVNMLIRATRLEKEKQEVVEAFLTQAVHNFVRFTDSCSEDNIGQELRHFTSYLIKAYFVGLVAVRKGSVVIILDCHTLEGLELLWSDYCSGHLDKVAERYLVSEEIKRKLNVETICLETVIEEENYSKCRKALMELPSTSSGKINSTLEPQQLVRIGGKNGPFEGPLRTISEDSYQNCLANPGKQVAGRFDFVLDGHGHIIPGLSPDILKPQELLISGGENDPLEVEITTVNEEEQLERAFGDPNKPVPPRVDFHLIGGKIIPELSSGLRLYSDFPRLPLHYQQNPERLWKLERMTTDGDLQMYATEIKIALENAGKGQYLIKPTEPVTLETFKQMLRRLPWVKMYSFEELRKTFHL